MSTANSYQIGQYVFIIVPVDELAFIINFFNQ